MTSPLTLTSLPLFPLGAVLFPGGLLSLRVFEVRYLDMVRKCHQAGAPFGVVALASENEVRHAGASQEQLCEVGTLATIDTLSSPQSGLLLLRCSGQTRFRINHRQQLPYGLWVADVQQIPADACVPIPPDLQRSADTLARVLASLRLRDPSFAAVPEPTPSQLQDCSWVSNRWCELLPLPLPVRQRLLELDNPLIRLELLEDTLEQMDIVS